MGVEINFRPGPNVGYDFGGGKGAKLGGVRQGFAMGETMEKARRKQIAGPCDIDDLGNRIGLNSPGFVATHDHAAELGTGKHCYFTVAANGLECAIKILGLV
jgi:hypothetical protein